MKKQFDANTEFLIINILQFLFRLSVSIKGMIDYTKSKWKLSCQNSKCDGYLIGIYYFFLFNFRKIENRLELIKIKHFSFENLVIIYQFINTSYSF